MLCCAQGQLESAHTAPLVIIPLQERRWHKGADNAKMRILHQRLPRMDRFAFVMLAIIGPISAAIPVYNVLQAFFVLGRTSQWHHVAQTSRRCLDPLYKANAHAWQATMAHGIRGVPIARAVSIVHCLP